MSTMLMSRDVLMSVSIEVNTLGFDPGEGGAVPSRTTKNVTVGANPPSREQLR